MKSNYVNFKLANIDPNNVIFHLYFLHISRYPGFYILSSVSDVIEVIDFAFIQ